MIIEKSVSAVYDGTVLIPDHPIELKIGKKYHLIIEDIPPGTTQKKVYQTKVTVVKSLN